MTELTIVRENLMTQQSYTPYCGNSNCGHGMPRTIYIHSKSQFECGCGWVSEFPSDFIKRYKEK